MSISIQIFSQSEGKIIYKYGSPFIIQDNVTLSMYDLKKMLTNNEAAKNEYNLYESKLKTARIVSLSFGVVALGGCSFMLIPLLSEHSNISMTTPAIMTLGGTIGMYVGVTMMNKSLLHLHKSIDIYNSKLTSDYNGINKLELNLGLTSNGVGVICRF
jgi:hypothetical protein